MERCEQRGPPPCAQIHENLRGLGFRVGVASVLWKRRKGLECKAKCTLAGSEDLVGSCFIEIQVP